MRYQQLPDVYRHQLDATAYYIPERDQYDPEIFFCVALLMIATLMFVCYTKGRTSKPPVKQKSGDKQRILTDARCLAISFSLVGLMSVSLFLFIKRETVWDQKWAEKHGIIRSFAEVYEDIKRDEQYVLNLMKKRKCIE